MVGCLTFSFVVCWIALTTAFLHVKLPYSYNRMLKSGAAIRPDVENDAATQRFLPLLQFYHTGSLMSEVWFNDDDFNMSLAKFEALLKRIVSENKAQSSDHSLLNIYSDKMLENALLSDDNDHQILKVYSFTCRSCQRFEPTFASAVQNFGSQISFMQANIHHIPVHMNKIRSQYFDANSENVSTCQVCNGDGKVTCSDCVGKGFNMKGNIAVICGTCGGKKIMRCNACGGLCVNCTV